MKKDWYTTLSRRERQIMDIIYQSGGATVGDVIEEMHDAPTYSSVRALMNILKDKGHLKTKKKGARYQYLPTRARKEAARPALKRVMETFFDNSVEKTVAALLRTADANLSEQECERLSELINKAKNQG